MSVTNQDEFWSHIKILFTGVFECVDRIEAEGERKMHMATQKLNTGHANMQTALK